MLIRAGRSLGWMVHCPRGLMRRVERKLNATDQRETVGACERGRAVSDLLLRFIWATSSDIGHQAVCDLDART